MTDRLSGTKFVIFTIICVGFSLYLASVIGNWSFEARTPYQAEFASAQGLLVNDAVKISGVTVGKVTGIEVTQAGTAMVSFEVDDEHELTDEGGATIRWRDVFGLRFLYVEPGAGEPVDAGHVYGTGATAGAVDLNVLLERLVPVMTALDPEVQNELLEALSTGLVGRDQDVQELIEDGARLTSALASRDQQIEALVTDATTVVSAYANRREELQGLLASFADVAESIASRNDLLESSVVRVADAQEELDRLLADNDAELRRLLDEAEEVVSVVASRTDALEGLLETAGEGLISYHLISRDGQWFNIRPPGTSVGGRVVTTERGAQLPPRDPDAGPATGSAAMAGFLSGGGA